MGTTITMTMRYSNALITEANWDNASVMAASLPGDAHAHSAVVPYSSGAVVYMALKTQNGGGWSTLSNNAFWPHFDAYLPVILRGWELVVAERMRGILRVLWYHCSRHIISAKNKEVGR
jgi:hypothetical protein